MDSILGPNVAAHPRSRGENVKRAADLLEAEGSSPLTRGKLAAIAALVAIFGLIPAHAGKTLPERRRR